VLPDAAPLAHEVEAPEQIRLQVQRVPSVTIARRIDVPEVHHQLGLDHTALTRIFGDHSRLAANVLRMRVSICFQAAAWAGFG
jgi:hypothetical protein